MKMKDEKPIGGYNLKNMSSNKKKRLLDSLKTDEYQDYITKKKTTQKRNEKIAKFGIVGVIIAICTLLWLPQLLSTNTANWMFEVLGQRGAATSDFKIWQLFTSIWLHAGFIHLAINMFVFWSFGKHMEKIWGSKKLLLIYVLSGIGGSILTLPFSIIYPYTVGVGASGAICGLLGASAILTPDSKVLLFFFIPTKIKPVVKWFAIISFILAITNLLPMIGHAAHLGGLVIGYLIAWYWKSKGNLFTTFI